MSFCRTFTSQAFSFAATLAASVLFVAASSAAEPDNRIVRVEEDWELHVATPDPDNDAPQVSVVFAPTGNVDWAYAEFDINHHSHPSFVPGGLQLQVWSGGQPIVVNNDPDGGVISQPEERIRWTQSMDLEDDVLIFAVTKGNSATWGAFGGDGKLTIRTLAPLADLNGYDTAISLRNSGVGFAGNRVHSLKITAVRRYTADGRVITDDAEQICYERP
jgi:hypothetical protein